MRKLEIFLNVNAMVLVVIGLISFLIHNVADAIFYMVVAILIRQAIGKAYDR